MGEVEAQARPAVETENTSRLALSQANLLPEGWRIARLGDLAVRTFGGGTPSTKRPEFWDGPIPWTTTKVIGARDTYLGRFQRGITQEGLKGSSTQVAPKNSVLIGTRVGVGKAVVTPFDVAVNQDITVFVPNPDVVPEFLTLLLKVPSLQRWFSENKRGTTIKGVPRSDVLGLQLPLPPRPEQQTITHALRTVREATEATERGIVAARELKRSLMNHLFTYGSVPVGEAENVPLKGTQTGSIPEHWRVAKLGNVCNRFQYGTSQRCDADAKGNPVLRIPNVIGSRVSIDDLKYTRLPEKATDNLRLSAGDVLFVRTNGRREYVGRCAVFRGEPAEALFASYLIRAQLDESVLLPGFFGYYATTSAGRSWLSGRASEAADGKYNLNIQILKDVSVPLPPLHEQQRVVAMLETVESKIATETKRKQSLDVLFRTLLHNLMTGKVRINDLDLSAVEEVV